MMRLADLKYSVTLLAELERHGFQSVEDMLHVPNSQILSIPGMGGSAYRRLATAMGREAYVKCCRIAGRPRKSSNM